MISVVECSWAFPKKKLMFTGCLCYEFLEVISEKKK